MFVYILDGFAFVGVLALTLLGTAFMAFSWTQHKDRIDTISRLNETVKELSDWSVKIDHRVIECERLIYLSKTKD